MNPSPPGAASRAAGPGDLGATASEVFARPAEILHIDWYDGVVQAVYTHDRHGAWYAFALGAPSARERRVCMRPLADLSVLPELEELETLDDAAWLTRLGIERLLPACAPQGVELRLVDGAVAEVRVMSPDELEAARPCLPHELAP